MRTTTIDGDSPKVSDGTGDSPKVSDGTGDSPKVYDGTGDSSEVFDGTGDSEDLNGSPTTPASRLTPISSIEHNNHNLF